MTLAIAATRGPGLKTVVRVRRPRGVIFVLHAPEM